jgi:hypothetical protein
MILCQKTEEEFWESTYREIDYALTAAMRFEQEHTLPLLAIEATWAAIQQRSEKMLDIEKLMGKKETGGTMSKTEMLTEAGKLADFTRRQKAKRKKEEEDLESA